MPELWFTAFFVTMFLGSVQPSAHVVDVGSTFEKKWDTANLQNVDYMPILKLVKGISIKVEFNSEERFQLKFDSNKTSLTIKINPVERDDSETYTVIIEDREGSVIYNFELILTVANMLPTTEATPTASEVNFNSKPNPVQNVSTTDCDAHVNVSYSGWSKAIWLLHGTKKEKLNGQNGIINFVIKNVTDESYKVVIENNNYQDCFEFKMIANNATNTDPHIRVVCSPSPDNNAESTVKPTYSHDGSKQTIPSEIVGIVVAALCFVGLCGVIIFIKVRKKKKKSDKSTLDEEKIELGVPP